PGTNTSGPANADPATRWEQRNDWRKGKRGNPKIIVGGGANAEAKALGELRFSLGGATATNASGGFKGPAGDGSDGLLRNVDASADMNAIGASFVDYQTFPLGDSDGTQLATGCAYPGIIPPPANAPYTPHISEGIDGVAHNEFACLSSTDNGGQDQISDKTAIIHGVALQPADAALMAQRGASLIWSPRSNISLYGDTAQIPLFEHVGVNVALGTDWIPSGSENMLRELQCVIDVNGEHWNGELGDETIWRMVTANAAQALGVGDQLGTLAAGHRGDVAVFAKHGKNDYRAVIESSVTDVALVLRDGKPLNGNVPVVTALDATCTDTVDECNGNTKAVCTARETGETLAALKTAANGAHYELFPGDGDCTATLPKNEPTCDPSRTLASDLINGSSQYNGDVAGDSDGDGIPDDQDNCPHTFNPIRPLDGSVQADADGDGVGDVCDPCPLDADVTTCQTFDPNDKDGDGVPNASDNCPNDANADQHDSDGDLKGDACDACPNDSNPGTAGCPKSLYDIKSSDPETIDGVTASIPDTIVTGIAPNGYFIAVDPTATSYNGPDNSCAFVFQTAGTKPAQGDKLVITSATASNFFDEIELKNVAFTVASSGNALPDAAVLAPADIVSNVALGARSPLEACLVHVDDATVSNAAPTPGAGESCIAGSGATTPCNEFEITGGMRVDDLIFLITPQPSLGATFVSIQGPVQFKNGLLKIEPRDADDIAQGPPALAAIEPALSFVRLSTTGSSFPTAMQVRMDRAPDADQVVLLDSTSAEVTVPTSVTILAHTTSIAVPVTASATADTATISARLLAADTPKTAQVTSIATDAVPHVISIDPTDATVALNGTQSFTVAFDIPAPVTTGASVALVVAPAELGSTDAALAVAENELGGSFTFTAGTAPATGTVTAAIGADTPVSATVSVVAAADPFISEVDYDQTGTDSAEFFEISNPGSAFDLTGTTVVLINGSSSGTSFSVYDTLNLSGSIPAGGKVVIGNVAGAILPVSALQNGPADGVALLD
ncbi:MAG TPA: amidohydrolase family protein, partial [Myxococcota bacterium]